MMTTTAICNCSFYSRGNGDNTDKAIGNANGIIKCSSNSNNDSGEGTHSSKNKSDDDDNRKQQLHLQH